MVAEVETTAQKISRRHQRFAGNFEDLVQFERLAGSPIRAPERSLALNEWSDYKKQRQVQAFQKAREAALAEALQRGEITSTEAKARAVAQKGFSIQAAVYRAVDLRGADLCPPPPHNSQPHSPQQHGGLTIGYVDLRGAILDGACLHDAWLEHVRS